MMQYPKVLGKNVFTQEREENIDSKVKPKKFTWVSVNIIGWKSTKPKNLRKRNWGVLIFAQLSILCTQVNKYIAGDYWA